MSDDALRAQIAAMQAERFAQDRFNLSHIQRNLEIEHEGERFILDVVGQHGTTQVIVFRALILTPEEMQVWSEGSADFQMVAEADQKRFLAARAHFARQGLTDIPVYFIAGGAWDPVVSKQVAAWYKDRGMTINIISPQ